MENFQIKDDGTFVKIDVIPAVPETQVETPINIDYVEKMIATYDKKIADENQIRDSFVKQKQAYDTAKIQWDIDHPAHDNPIDPGP